MGNVFPEPTAIPGHEVPGTLQKLTLHMDRVGALEWPGLEKGFKAQTLLAGVRRYPSFPIVLEAYREVLQEHFDMTSLEQVLRDAGLEVKRQRRFRPDKQHRFFPTGGRGQGLG